MGKVCEKEGSRGKGREEEMEERGGVELGVKKTEPVSETEK